jgi:hypothetical protein
VEKDEGLMTDMRAWDLREIRQLAQELLEELPLAALAAHRNPHGYVPTEHVTRIASAAHALDQRVARHRTF